MAKYLLVSFKTCPWVQRAAIVLREKQIDFEFRHIEPDNRPDWFLAISPHKKVPVLRLDDRISLFESNAIAEFLDETVAPRLHPEDPIARAVNRAWTDYLPTFAGIVTATAYADTQADYDKAAAQVPVPFERLEKALEKQGSGPFFNGARYALVDRSEEHTSELQSPCNLVCRLLLEKKKKKRSMRPAARTVSCSSAEWP